MTPTASRRVLAAGTALAAGLALLSGCTGDKSKSDAASGFHDTKVPAGALRLVAFDSCADALAKLKQAAKESVGPYGFGGYGIAEDAMGRAALAPGAPAAAGDAKATAPGPVTGGQPNYSGTNTHESGVDEPDLVKTDGRRIVTVGRGGLRVVDPATRRVTGKLDLRDGLQDPVQWAPVDLLMQGDRALVMIRETYGYGLGIYQPDGPVPPDDGPSRTVGPKLLLVDLSGTPRVLSTYRVDGGLVDARQVGATARVVIRSAPRIRFPMLDKGTEAQRTAANKKIIDKSGADAWLPRYEVTTGGRTSKGQVSCDRVSRPPTYSGTSMLSVLTFDLGSSGLGDGDAVTIVADGETVYSNGPSLYVASDQRWRMTSLNPKDPVDRPGKLPDQATDIYKFDTSKPGRPQYVAAGSVKGWLVNQYALSEWDGNLRVATTTGQTWDPNAKSSSTVYVLSQRDDSLVERGKVTGLGKGERIYSVRFAGPIGYVVTFRQTDPLYTVDLSDAGRPRVTGELKITGYSAYLHPIGDGRLIGIGQEASTQGRALGTQVSLFDVSNLERPVRLAQHHVRAGQSEAEFDPHAFLYWPDEKLLVVPLTVFNREPQPNERLKPAAGAMLLRVTDGGFAELGMVSHSNAAGNDKFTGVQIRRSLVVDGVLWTVSDAGLKASSLSTLDSLAWLPF